MRPPRPALARVSRARRRLAAVGGLDLAALSLGLVGAVATTSTVAPMSAGEPLAKQQVAAIESGRGTGFHWGPKADAYIGWSNHSNRLVPVYTFGTAGAGPGIDLNDYLGEKSAYRDAGKVAALYHASPAATVDAAATYGDQTDLACLQQVALETGKKKHIVLFVFDGMDWQTTWAAALARADQVAYTSGRGTGLHFQDYAAGGTSQFGAVVTSPRLEGLKGDVDAQTVGPAGRPEPGGYSREWGGPEPWGPHKSLGYLISKPGPGEPAHAYPDSAATATALCTGQKTYNAAINVLPDGEKLMTVAHRAQSAGRSVGVVTSVPISHATPASAYSHNVDRDDYQDLTRDLIGRPSVSHPTTPLPGVDVLLGAGWGANARNNSGQGGNFVPGNRYLADADLKAIDVAHGGPYVVARRTAGQAGSDVLAAATERAVKERRRLFGFFGVKEGHLPFRTADGDFKPVVGKTPAEVYSDADVRENPTLAQMTTAALTVLSQNEKGFWLMVEAGDVDWANHDNNLDNSVGAVYAGDDAVKAVTDWVEAHSNWDETLLIVTADHGHLLVLDDPSVLLGSARPPAPKP